MNTQNVSHLHSPSKAGKNSAVDFMLPSMIRTVLWLAAFIQRPFNIISEIKLFSLVYPFFSQAFKDIFADRKNKSIFLFQIIFRCLKKVYEVGIKLVVQA